MHTGSIVKRLHEYEVESARAHEHRLASAQRMDDLSERVRELRAEKQGLLEKQAALEQETQELNKQLAKLRVQAATTGEAASGEPATVSVETVDHVTESVEGIIQEESSEDSSAADSHSSSRTRRLKGRVKDPHPPGFRSLSGRIEKFSGRQGDDDFELWVMDFNEATTNCGWNDVQRAKWFSWFLSGPAKATWQRTLQAEDKSSWSKIVQIYRGQYGIHMDPRIVYQRCQELQYSQFGSAQGLLNAMRDYQRMAPEKLTDATMESILWNKVPLELQQELKEIPDGSVQELLQKLLRAEATIQERARRKKETNQNRPPRATPHRDSNTGEQDNTPRRGGSNNASPQGGQSQRDQGQGEMSMRGVKCFNCRKKGHLAAKCPEPPRKTENKPTGPARMIESGEKVETVENSNPWVLAVATNEETTQLTDGTVPRRGPTYKVVAEVDGIRTKAFLDHGAQVSLVRQELLPMIQQKHGWTMEQYQQRNLKLDRQPVGASGEALGVMAAVVLKVTIEGTNKTFSVPCYVLKSCKPLWNGELYDCGLVLGTNALEPLGFQITHPSGKQVGPAGGGCDSVELQPVGMESGTAIAVYVVLDQKLRLGPFQSKVIQASTSNTDCDKGMQSKLITPSESLADMQCDFMDEVWEGKSTGKVLITNWSGEPRSIESGEIIGNVEQVSRVSPEDPIWSSPEVTVAQISQLSDEEVSTRKSRLESQLILGNSCSSEEQRQLKELLLLKHDSFAIYDEELGETDLVEHSIDTGNAKPVKTFPRRLPYALREELDGELNKLMATGCIDQSTSPYASGLVLVRKKDGSLRVCVDYRQVNKDTVPDRYPMPRVDELVDAIGRRQGKYFSTMDLMKGYHQVKMEDQSKHKTAFTCHRGLFQYRRMPFGLTNAPATFQRLMNKLFTGEEWKSVFVYLDDILVVSPTFEEHLRDVGRVLDQLAKAGLRLKPAKCCFARNEVEYLGFTISTAGVQPNSNKVKAIMEIPQPTDSKSVRRFIGMVNFYRRHIKDLAAVARPLTALTRKDKATGRGVPFQWTTDCERAFSVMKERLATAPVLRPPDLDKHFYVWTDASLEGFGAVLEQLDDNGQHHPIAYASRQTNAAEKKYAPTELEVAALIFAMEYFEVYLLGRPCTVYTDHQALVSAFLVHLKSQTRGLLARWYLRISKFLPHLKLEYKPGAANVVADTLSRAPAGSGTAAGVTKGEVLRVSQPEVSQTALHKVQLEQGKDKELSKLISILTEKLLPDDPQEAKMVLNLARKGYYMVDGILYFEGADAPDRRRVVVLEHLKQEILSEHHDFPFAGHFGAKKMAQQISQYFFWNGLKADVYKKCASCISCASVKGQGKKGKPPLVSIPVGSAFDCIGMDIVELDKTRDGNRYALVFQDYLSKWPEVYALPDHKAETVAKCLLDLVWRHGVPNRIIHDRAAEFLSDILQETARLIGVKQLPTSGGHPQTDGLVERFNKTLKQMLSKVVAKGGSNWDKMLGPVLLAYRVTPHSSTGISPFFLVYGRTPCLPTTMDFMNPLPKFPVVETEYGAALEKELKEVRSLAKKNLQVAQRKQKIQYDKGTKLVDLKVGDLVMLSVQPRYKLDRRFKGPFVIESLTETNAVIQVKGDKKAEPWNVSRQRLSKCSELLAGTEPWLGQSGKLRKRRVVKKKEPPVVVSPLEQGQVTVKTTRRGREVRRPAWFMTVSCDSQGRLSSNEGGSCNDRTIRDHERGHASREARKETRPRGSTETWL